MRSVQCEFYNIIINVIYSNCENVRSYCYEVIKIIFCSFKCAYRMMNPGQNTKKVSRKGSTLALMLATPFFYFQSVSFYSDTV